MGLSNIEKRKMGEERKFCVSPSPLQSWCTRARDKTGAAGRMASCKRIKQVSKYMGDSRAISHCWRKALRMWKGETVVLDWN